MERGEDFRKIREIQKNSIDKFFADYNHLRESVEKPMKKGFMKNRPIYQTTLSP